MSYSITRQVGRRKYFYTGKEGRGDNASNGWSPASYLRKDYTSKTGVLRAFENVIDRENFRFGNDFRVAHADLAIVDEDFESTIKTQGIPTL